MNPGAPAGDSGLATTVGAYRVVRDLSGGIGGMSAVYEARQPGDDAVVAVKVANDRHYGQLLQEANTLLRIQHPNIIKILPILDARAQPTGVHVALASVDGASRAFIVLEYLGGGSLQDLIAAEKRLPVRQAARIASEVAAGLAHAHAQGIVHLDIKPSNVMFNSGRKRTVILDFGIARRSDDWYHTERRVMGSLSYAAPERLRTLPGDGRSDIYSLGVCLFEMLTGMRPFQAGDANALRVKVLTEPAPLLSSFDPALKPYDQILDRCLAKEPDKRTPSANVFLEELAPLTKRHRPAVPWYIGLAAAGVGAATLATAVAFTSTLGSRTGAQNGPTEIPTGTAVAGLEASPTLSPTARPATSTPVAMLPSGSHPAARLGSTLRTNSIEPEPRLPQLRSKGMHAAAVSPERR